MEKLAYQTKNEKVQLVTNLQKGSRLPQSGCLFLFLTLWRRKATAPEMN